MLGHLRRAGYRVLRQPGAFDLLVIDERLLERPDELFSGMLLELFELRYGKASTVPCTQFRKKDWHPRPSGGMHTGAIVDRIVRNAVWLEMGGMNMRQAMAGKGTVVRDGDTAGARGDAGGLIRDSRGADS